MRQALALRRSRRTRRKRADLPCGTCEQPPESGTILLANDHERPRLELRSLLVDHGYRVIDVGDGLAAVRAFHAFGRQIGAVLLDHRMPGLMGAVVAEAIHAMRPDVPIVSVSPLDNPLAPYRAGLIRAAVRLPCMAEDILRTLTSVMHSSD